MAYHAVATRDTLLWRVHVTELDRHVHVKNLSDVESAARELIASCLGIPVDSFDVDCETMLPASALIHLERARECADTAARMKSESAAERRAAALELRDAGLTVREIGAVMGVSHQRAAQLTS